MKGSNEGPPLPSAVLGQLPITLKAHYIQLFWFFLLLFPIQKTFTGLEGKWIIFRLTSTFDLSGMGDPARS